MLAESYTAVIARGEDWVDGSTTEPYEASWAREAIIMVRTLETGTLAAGARAHVQMSLDGMRWVDEGTTLPMPQSTEQDSCARIAHFGNWLRIVTELPADVATKVLVTVHLK